VVLAVSPDWRRQGVGRDLMLWLERAFAEQSVRLIHLEVRTTNEAARALYQNLGFTVAGRRLSYYTNGDDGFLMIKAMDAPAR
jgi:ribosomal-protein-alanine N-acetyltransferase